MNERIKELRKTLGLTQQEFADKLGISRNNIATYETRKTGPGNSVIKLICNTFNVNEEWLRNGIGEKFLPKPETVIDEIVRDYGLDDLDRQIIREFIELPEQDREAIRAYLQSIIATRKQSEADKKAEFMKLASDSYDSEKKQASQALSAKESDVG